jgi:PAS domain S-box-containing protein
VAEEPKAESPAGAAPGPDAREAELLEQRRRLDMAAEATGIAFWEWDGANGALSWSDANRRIFGLEPHETPSLERYWTMVHPDDQAMVRAAFERAEGQPGGGDYAVEYRIVRPDGEQRWVVSSGRVRLDEAGRPRLIVGASQDITRRKQADLGRDLLLRELAHREKNGLSVIMAIVAQTARTQRTAKGLEEQLMARLQAMARSQELVTGADGRSAPLGEVIATALAPFGAARFDIDPALDLLILRGDLAASMGLLLHEMATNAVKYGSLSNDGGRVGVAAEAAGPGRGAFRWRERDGPPVAQPTRKGFGSRLLSLALRPQGGEVRFEFEPDGFLAVVEFPTTERLSAAGRS